MNLTKKAVSPYSSRNLALAWVPELSGQQHDAWTAPTLDGHEVRLRDFKGKAAFLSFWSTTCAPCIAEMPGMERLVDSEKSEKVAFLAVTQEDESTVRESLREHPLRVPVYLSIAEPPSDLLGCPDDVYTGQARCGNA
jgi:thiol-disulfide isomerase/thioredoxin